MERMRTVTEIVEAMNEDPEVGEWIERYAKQRFVGGSESDCAEEFMAQMNRRYEHYATTPIEFEMDHGDEHENCLSSA